MKSKNLRLLTLTAMFAALTMLVTACIMHIPTGFNNGYIHLGDTMIYIAASMLICLIRGIITEYLFLRLSKRGNAP